MLNHLQFAEKIQDSFQNKKDIEPLTQPVYRTEFLLGP